MPWSGEVVDLIDELCAERLPEHLTKEARAERRRSREAEAGRERERAERQALIDDALAKAAELERAGRARLLAGVEEELGEHRFQAWTLRQRIAELDAAEAEAASSEERHAA